MLLILLAYLGGVLTILSPCILPVLPFVFARADQPFGRSTLPLLAGMAVTFAAGDPAAVGGGWAAQANQVGRALALVLLALFAVTLLFPRLAERLRILWSTPAIGWRRSLRRTASRPASVPRSCSASPRVFSGRLAPVRFSASC